MDKEEKYLDIRQKLQNLEQVKASDNFIHNLHSKIVEIEAEKRQVHEKRFDEGRGGFLRNLFGNMQYPWLVPAAGFTVLIFFVFYITFLNKNASENNQQLLSDQKQETTEQKNSPADQNKTSETVPDKTLTEKEKLPGKDIAGEFKTENERSPSPVEDKRQFTDRDIVKDNKIELKATEPEPLKNEEQAEDEIEDAKEFAKKENESEKIETNSLATESPTDKSSVTESVKSAEPDDKLKGKAKSDDSLKTKLDNKLMRVSKSNLEKIRDEILK